MTHEEITEPPELVLPPPHRHVGRLKVAAVVGIAALVAGAIGTAITAVAIGAAATSTAKAATTRADRSAEALDAALDDRDLTSCRTRQRADIDSAVVAKSNADAALNRIRTEADIDRASGTLVDLGPYIARARAALDDIDARQAEWDAAAQAYEDGAERAVNDLQGFLAECRR